ncbi:MULTISPECIES: bifunctional DNA-formamidopyrimidine glycosylase/DNA-(apurinic or apyrimidinic site) lyase [unclassified Methylophaga]|uniref:bifunctional DNA-formamidopyrimidine glycosylase/DNA-(apurinic or apyrimidinic site) lyase n=1 Tax=unclassified Methylophaga TaxID=2629249 RepID=UPI000C9898D6|nr:MULTISPECIES: bifunctional DNA-formamidopyrimidine glycosylase/DNA-(apurinic or apyrimidinic site) lyase [unclassified Methylophaga]MBN46088.1 DNA-formamidopyrimidine glycosylase [Methylophaga sp.]|tara:strand:- start:130696 stop:131514 length:819 start_codon:yes stop_codon:yes gene_type:complete
MPELPEVETTRSGITPYVENNTVERVVIRDSRLRWPITDNLDEKISGQVIQSVSRRAKYLLFTTATGTLFIHLGMSGRLRILTVFQPPEKHDHVDIVFADGIILRFTDPRRFGAVLWTSEPPMQHPLLNHLGPEPLEDAFDAEYLLQRSRKRQVSIKTFIMNAEIVVGVGNIYASESLFLSGIHPQLMAAKLKKSQAEKLVDAVKLTLQKAIAAGGTTLRDFRDSEGKPGYFAQELWVYARQNMGCKQCGHPIELIRQSQRATYFCPQCQKR